MTIPFFDKRIRSFGTFLVKEPLRMASKFTRSVPPLDPKLVPNAEKVMQDIANCEDLTQMTALLKTWADAQKKDVSPSRYAYPLQIGAAYRMAMDNKFFGTGPEARDRNAALVKATEYSLVHMRTCARLYADSNIIESSIADYEKHKDNPIVTRGARKAEGIDFALNCIKFSKKLQDSLRSKKPLTEALEDANKMLPPLPVERKVPPLSATQRSDRKDAVIVSLMTMLRLATETEDAPFSMLIENLSNVNDFITVVETAAYSEEEEKLFNLLIQQSAVSPANAYEAARDTLQLINDALGIADEDDKGEDENPPPPPPPPPSTPPLTSATPEMMTRLRDEGFDLDEMSAREMSETYQAMTSTDPVEGTPEFNDFITFPSTAGKRDGVEENKTRAMRAAREAGWKPRQIEITEIDGGFEWKVKPPILKVIDTGGLSPTTALTTTGPRTTSRTRNRNGDRSNA